MKDEKHDGDDLELPFSKLLDLSSEPCNLAQGRRNERQKHSFSKSLARHLDVATTPSISTIQSPGIEAPGIFFEPDTLVLRIAPTAAIGSKTDEEDYIEQFHDSEDGDIYTLFNACNGDMRDGVLDVRKLDELSEEELEVLDVKRLKEIWLHTISGCPTCDGIVSTLKCVRGMLAEDEPEPTLTPSTEDQLH
jgi:hypothetical protein